MDDAEHDARTDELLARIERAPLIPEHRLNDYRVNTGLTPRERDVLRCLAHGLTDRMAGDTLGLSVHTVRTHLRHARYKLNAKTTTHACCLALRLGLID